jgi:hypothetical protein
MSAGRKALLVCCEQVVIIVAPSTAVATAQQRILVTVAVKVGKKGVMNEFGCHRL